MAKLNQTQIRDRAKLIIKDNPTGIRYSELVNQIVTENPETPKNTVHGSVWDLETRFPSEIHKPTRGLYMPLPSGTVPVVSPHVPSPKLPKEEEFYEPFATWLKNELDEVTVAIPVGGAGFQKKWGTPDVVGVYKPLAYHHIKFELEIVSAESKAEPSEPVCAIR